MPIIFVLKEMREEDFIERKRMGGRTLSIKEITTNVLPRKIITASIAGSLFAILFGLVTPSPFGDEINSIKAYLWAFVMVTPIYLMYSFPVIFIYGTITSIISDLLANLITRGKLKRMENYISVLFHLLFGVILLWISLSASIVYFVVDRFLMKKRDSYRWINALQSLVFPLFVWLIFMGIIWLVDFLENWPDFLV
ncbi:MULTISPECIES: hypothetical protein [Robertmurraya]|uniref:hypothetical protein n=1 Tax=Robertmurraya TaxID=2837507 RepID=UPI001FD3F013|nr:hypothetical protein [Robertmurraya siralis]